MIDEVQEIKVITKRQKVTLEPNLTLGRFEGKIITKSRGEKRACEGDRESVFRVLEAMGLQWGSGWSGQEGELRKASIKKTEEKRREEERERSNSNNSKEWC